MQCASWSLSVISIYCAVGSEDLHHHMSPGGNPGNSPVQVHQAREPHVQDAVQGNPPHNGGVLDGVLAPWLCVTIAHNA